MFKKAEALKEIRLEAKNNGLTFKENGVKINGTPLYAFVDRKTGETLMDNCRFWTAYEDCQSGYIQKLAGNEPAKPVIVTAVEYEICGERSWLIKHDGVRQGGGYIGENELEGMVGTEKAQMIIGNEAQDYQWEVQP
jgi:hypothetical protein